MTLSNALQFSRFAAKLAITVSLAATCQAHARGYSDDLVIAPDNATSFVRISERMYRNGTDGALTICGLRTEEMVQQFLPACRRKGHTEDGPFIGVAEFLRTFVAKDAVFVRFGIYERGDLVLFYRVTAK
jgi:hypothetical protein